MITGIIMLILLKIESVNMWKQYKNSQVLYLSSNLLATWLCPPSCQL